MGNWQLEVFKMAIYIAFPVTLFHYFNYPGNIDNDLLELRKEIMRDSTIDDKNKLFKVELEEAARNRLKKHQQP